MKYLHDIKTNQKFKLEGVPYTYIALTDWKRGEKMKCRFDDDPSRFFFPANFDHVIEVVE